MGADASGIPFVGRESELAELRTALESAVACQGRLVLLGGEPGIGKTRLARIIAQDAAARGVAICWGSCWEHGAPAFWPWMEALGRWMRQTDRHTVAAVAGPVAPQLAQVLPVVRELLPDLPAEAAWESDQARFRLFDAVSRFLGAIAGPRGLVLVLDDVHWADAASLKLLEFVTRDLPDLRVLVMATYRDTEVRRGDPLQATLSGLTRVPVTRRLPLPGLCPTDCAQYAAATGIRADEEFGVELHRETGGNPFFLGEIVRWLTAEGGLDAGVGRVGTARLLSPGVREVVSRRVDRLGEACRTVLCVGALLGATFDARLLATVLSAVEDSNPVVLDALERAVSDGILTGVNAAPGRYAFAHALISKTLADELGAVGRAGWHARIARVMEDTAIVDSEGTAAELARHFAAAGTTADLAKAFAYARRAAEQAMARFGWEEAARRYEMALELGLRSGALNVSGSIALLCALARALRRSGQEAAARARCEEALSLCRAHGRADLLVGVAVTYAGDVPEWGRLDPARRAVLEEAVRLAEAAADPLQARVQARLATDITFAHEDAAALDRVPLLCDRALAAARRCADPGALAHALAARLHWAQLIRPLAPDGAWGDADAVPATDEIIAAATAARDLEQVVTIRLTRLMGAFAAGAAQTYWEEINALQQFALSSRVPVALWAAEASAAMRAAVEGRFDDARRLSERAYQTGRRLEVRNVTGVHLSQQIMLYAVQGRLAELSPALTDFTREQPTFAVWRPFAALARLAAGDVAAARAEFELLLAGVDRLLAPGVSARFLLAGLAALCVGLRDRAHAEMLRQLVARPTDEVWSVNALSTVGPWALAQGSLARLLGRHTEAETHFRGAIAASRRMRARPVVAQAQCLLAALWLADDANPSRWPAGLTLLAEAEETARALGIVDVLARAERLRARRGSDPRAAAPRAADNRWRREGDYWSVCYAGTTVRLRDGKGVRYLAQLLATPGREVHVLDLAAGNGAGTVIFGLGRAAAGPDARALYEYRARLGELRAELDEAERYADLGRRERLQAEIDQLVQQLARRVGRRARAEGPAETARKAVSKAIRTQLQRITATHPALGRHLVRAVRTGTFCVYAPPEPTNWAV